MELGHLRTFLAVLAEGSFSRAAQALHVSQSTVSFQIRGLEEEAGVRLLDRRAGLRPTAAGRTLRRYAARLVELDGEALARVREDAGGERGQIAIAASTIPGEILLPPALARLRRAFPRVAVRVDESDSQRALAALLAEEVDLALVGAEPADRRVVARPFAEDQVVLVGLAGRAPQKLTRRELEGVSLVLREEGSGTQRAAGLPPRPRDAADLRVSSAEAARRAVLAGLGLGFLSRLAIADDLAAGRLAIVKLPGTPIRRRFHVARLRAVTPPPAARALVELLAGDD